jgi:hypothetical protein
MHRRVILMFVCLVALSASSAHAAPFLIRQNDLTAADYGAGFVGAFGQLSLILTPDRADSQIIITISDEANGFHAAYPVVVDDAFFNGFAYVFIGHTRGGNSQYVLIVDGTPFFDPIYVQVGDFAWYGVLAAP